MGEEAGGCRKTPKSKQGLNCLTSINAENIPMRFKMIEFFECSLKVVVI